MSRLAETEAAVVVTRVTPQVGFAVVEAKQLGGARVSLVSAVILIHYTTGTD